MENMSRCPLGKDNYVRLSQKTNNYVSLSNEKGGSWIIVQYERTAVSRCRLRKEDYVLVFDVKGGICLSLSNRKEDHGSLAK
jgi:hypothetical protein